jgi:hypothetical protein
MLPLLRFATPAVRNEIVMDRVSRPAGCHRAAWGRLAVALSASAAMLECTARSYPVPATAADASGGDAVVLPGDRTGSDADAVAWRDAAWTFRRVITIDAGRAPALGRNR